MNDLLEIARALVHPGKGILAADESTKSADARLASYGIATGEEMRRKERDMLLSCPGLEEYLSGVILYDETLRQNGEDGRPFGEILSSRGIIPGIKVDEGTEPAPESPDELITKGLLGLPERLTEYREQFGTGFTKWRAVVKIDGDRLPTRQVMVENAKRLAEYSALVQKAGMVPMVEPEVLLEGNHSRMRSRQVLEETLSVLVEALENHAVDMSGVILKTAMAISGSTSGRTDTPEEVAEDTVGALMNVMPRGLAGVVFLSGGQTPDQATDNLRAIEREAKAKNAPWPMTFSYSRALQDEALRAWAGKDENVEVAREAYMKRLKSVYQAAKGE
ncbi:MAG TPA: class I fructose-bisphosphate aldolase [Candidatus Paceibacterota bacterium]|nr:class I fructose-bisphosphate aldolase [Candidatus Paceibacterota bacterium]